MYICSGKQWCLNPIFADVSFLHHAGSRLLLQNVPVLFRIVPVVFYKPLIINCSGCGCFFRCSIF